MTNRRAQCTGAIQKWQPIFNFDARPPYIHFPFFNKFLLIWGLSDFRKCTPILRLDVIYGWSNTGSIVSYKFLPFFTLHLPTSLPLWLTHLLDRAYEVKITFHESLSWCKCSLWMPQMMLYNKLQIIRDHENTPALDIWPIFLTKMSKLLFLLNSETPCRHQKQHSMNCSFVHACCGKTVAENEIFHVNIGQNIKFSDPWELYT